MQKRARGERALFLNVSSQQEGMRGDELFEGSEGRLRLNDTQPADQTFAWAFSSGEVPRRPRDVAIKALRL